MTMEAVAPETALADTVREAAAPRGSSWYFCFFFVSGFCSLLYELVWLRLAMAQFGVTTATVSIVLSCFMAGLGIGSWAAGYVIRKLEVRSERPPLHLYAMTEMLIGASAALVPLELLLGRFLLEQLGNAHSLSSAGYYAASGIWLAFTLVPWCACMGATVPLGMHAIRRSGRSETRRSFSFLYLANVLGALFGAIIPLLIVEVRGFSGTLQIGMLLNLAIGAAALRLASRDAQTAEKAAGTGTSSTAVPPASGALTAVELRHALRSRTLWLLFFSGLTSMGMEVVWTREYTIFVGTLVYSFAAILAVYLGATFIGSKLYRLWSRRRERESRIVWLIVWLAALLPLVTADARIDIPAWLRVPAGIAGFSALLGFLTPMLVDRFAAGDPDRAGFGYAVNIAGCILGPLIAGFVLLPAIGERYALTALALPWLAFGAWSVLFSAPRPAPARAFGYLAASAVTVCAALAIIILAKGYVEQTPGAQVRRDSTATVVATGEGMRKRLFVNGISMTVLTPITKMMAALPLAFLDRSPRNALVICFGMGTTHRSVLSWGIDSTVVDLVPSVPALFWYFHPDAPELLRSPQSHVVIDDGRRFLERTADTYDVIIIDPPPPIGAAGSSLLYSREFYATALKRLRPDGILQQWYPGGDATTTAAVARALRESFPYVRAFESVAGWGIHYLASRQPIPERTAIELADRVPPHAEADLVEWGPFPTAAAQFAAVLQKEIPIEWLIAQDPTTPGIQDDRPVNEYYFLRRHGLR